MIDIMEILAPPDIVAAFREGRREGSAIITWCPRCSNGPRDRKLRALIYRGKPWWGCMRCHCEKDYRAERNAKFERFRLEGIRGSREYDEKMKHDAQQLFEEGKPASPGDFVHRYLQQTRGLSLQGDLAPADLHAKRAFNRDLKERGITTYPLCMVAAVRASDGSFIAAHRTYLYELEDGRVVKLSDPLVPESHRVREAKKALGSTAGGAIRLGIDSDAIGIAEGIESALGLAQSTGLVCWAALSSSGMRGIVLPKNITRVVIGPDIGDSDGIGAHSAEVLQERLRREARADARQLIVTIKPPPVGCSDWGEARSKK